ncbi:MAG: S8 family serine peptidase, partial [Gammaproteobacteria bacterium]
FSNFGATAVDIGAPGFDVASTYMGNAYWWMSGTSMAAPHVAGVVALLRGVEPGLSAQQVIDRVFDSARPLAALNGITVTGAMLNAQSALTGSTTEPNPPPPPPPSPPDMPASLAAVDQGDGTAMLSWPMDDEATYYVVQREEIKTKGKNAGSWSGTTTFNASQSPHIDASGAKQLRYRIAAANDAGYSPMTDWVNVTVTDSGSGDGGGGGGSGKCHPRRGC